jgi:hypothetical protein
MLRRLLSIAYILAGLTLVIVLYEEIIFSTEVREYFRIGFYRQFGHIVIAVELIIAGANLLVNHEKTNFVMALFGFTAVLDPVFNFLGIFTSSVPLYATIIYLFFAVISFWIAFTDAFKSGKISMVNVVVTFVFGLFIEWFFNSL